jgi:hypothetical protein
LLLGAVVGLVWTLIPLVQVFSGFTDAETNLSTVLSQEISKTLGPVTVGAALGLVGTIMVLVALFGSRYRSPWFGTLLWVLSILYLLVFPIGTILGVIVILYLVKHKDEFRERVPAGDDPEGLL